MTLGLAGAGPYPAWLHPNANRALAASAHSMQPELLRIALIVGSLAHSCSCDAGPTLQQSAPNASNLSRPQPFERFLGIRSSGKAGVFFSAFAPRVRPAGQQVRSEAGGSRATTVSGGVDLARASLESERRGLSSARGLRSGVFRRTEAARSLLDPSKKMHPTENGGGLVQGPFDPVNVSCALMRANSFLVSASAYAGYLCDSPMGSCSTSQNRLDRWTVGNELPPLDSLDCQPTSSCPLPGDSLGGEGIR